MRDKAVDVLLRIGMPAGLKGMVYICDALELFDTDPYYADGKISVLYSEIAKRRESTPSGVERSIRHAFETALAKGDRELLERYLDTVNTQNSNLMKSLYFRLRQEERKNYGAADCSAESCKMKKQIYHEAMNVFLCELEKALTEKIELHDLEAQMVSR